MPGDAETTPHLRPLDPRVRAVWWLSGSLVVVAATAATAIASLAGPLAVLRPWLPVVVLAGGTVTAWGVANLRYRRWRYALSEHHLEIRRGVLWTTISVIPYSRLQFVDTRQGPLDRLFDLTSLVVHTAAVGTSGTLPGLDTQTAAALRARLAEVEAVAPADDIPV